ncbi:DUF2971 domain-containing protein [Flavobacterium sp. P4023]|uniref:DUF2971 domain-containing protein n=1 Tax=Flavobacterium flabelliforme TaxID=2816119 RepID=A0ABS5CTF0_9FLAO|nr:DUF2971 domain-containing protein [Flavobacterium flabelliforme]MBP4141899.1 DUF2971 domain-containing protein [Flavobacterium flabelliforme]
MKLFRFQAINKLTLQNLNNQKNWIADPYEFNDPFEFSLYDKLFIDDYGDSRPLTQIETININKFREEINDYGVVCYSSDYTNKLLWSHYGDQHKGMCLVFEISKEKMEVIYKVNYQQRLPEINITDDSDTFDDIVKIVTTKSTEWKYENEYREVFLSKNMLDDYPGELVEIVFGCRTPFEDIKMLTDIAVSKNKEILISKMVISNSEYNLGNMRIGDNTKIPEVWKENNFKF